MTRVQEISGKIELKLSFFSHIKFCVIFYPACLKMDLFCLQ